MRKYLIIIFALSQFVLAQQVPANSQGQEAVRRRVQGLRHGINLSHWFSQVFAAEGYTEKHFNTYDTPADLKLIANLGFDHVRLTFNPEPLMVADGTLEPTMLKAYDKAADEALRDGLNVIMDAHPEDAFKRKLIADPASRVAFLRFWQAFAVHEAKRDPERVFFELLNEPEFQDGEAWAQYQNELLAAIRKIDSEHTLILAGERWSGLWEFIHLTPAADKNVIYNFHYYDPSIFTHQGATWSAKWFAPIRGLRYPSAPDEKLADAQPALEGKLSVLHYGMENWGAKRINMEMEIAAEWARLNHVVITCNEFGVYRRFADPGDRVQWISDVRHALESNGIGWTMWDYAGAFAIVDRQGETRNVDASVVKALGIHNPKQVLAGAN